MRTSKKDKYDDDEFRFKHPHFYPNLHEKCPALTAHQLLICAMIRDGFLSHEIGSFFKITERTVESHRRDIRRKLGLKKGELTGFLQAI
jgi:DNA-binding NarL/FixJ family response regulator